jgi:hypothetical protein
VRSVRRSAWIAGWIACAPVAVTAQAPRVDPPLWRPVVESAVVPGWGQFDLGQTRGWAYLAVEAAVWTGWGLSRHAGGEDRDAYRALAWREARGGPEPRVDGDFDYYERLGRWTRSGAWDVDPGQDGVQPETDPASFNGDAWGLAVAIFDVGPDAGPGDPAYDAALDYYRERAYSDGFLWDWTGLEAAQAEYRSLIDQSDRHFRQATLILGGAFLNRLVSAADAYLTQVAGRPASVRFLPLRRGLDLQTFLTLRVVLQ